MRSDWGRQRPFAGDGGGDVSEMLAMASTAKGPQGACSHCSILQPSSCPCLGVQPLRDAGGLECRHGGVEEVRAQGCWAAGVQDCQGAWVPGGKGVTNKVCGCRGAGESAGCQDAEVLGVQGAEILGCRDAGGVREQTFREMGCRDAGVKGSSGVGV